MKIFLKAGLIFGVLCSILSARIDAASNANDAVRVSKAKCTIEILTKNTEQFKQDHLWSIAQVKGSKEKLYQRSGSLLTQDNTIGHMATLYSADKLIECCTSSAFLMNKQTITLCERFLDIKRKSGSQSEKELYGNMDNSAFVNRLLTQRPLVLVDDTRKDRALLRNMNNPRSSTDFCYMGNDWHLIGTDEQPIHLPLAAYLSQDEVGLSSLFSIASNTVFINNGYRYENGASQFGCQGKDDTYEKSGYCVGLVGVRFERETAEYRCMIITKKQNTAENGYGLSVNPVGLLDAWAEFYEEQFPTWEEAPQNPNKYVNIPGTENYFNMSIYKKRMFYTVTKYIKYGIGEAKKDGKKAYIRIPGIGLGPWAVSPAFIPTQTKFFVQSCFEALSSLSQKKRKRISTFEFLWLDPFDDQAKIAPGVKAEFAFKNGNIDVNKVVGNHKLENDIPVMFSMNNIASPIPNGDHVLVTSYAWDGNAFVGNEYYMYRFACSGDPVAACCSSILYSQNPLINPCLLANNAAKVERIEASLNNKKKELHEEAIKINNNKKLVQEVLEVSGKNAQYYELHEKVQTLQKRSDLYASLTVKTNEKLAVAIERANHQEGRAEALQKQAFLTDEKHDKELLEKTQFLEKQSEEYRKILEAKEGLENKAKTLESFQKSIFFSLYNNQGKVAGITGLFAAACLLTWLWNSGNLDQFINKGKLA